MLGRTQPKNNFPVSYIFFSDGEKVIPKTFFMGNIPHYDSKFVPDPFNQYKNPVYMRTLYLSMCADSSTDISRHIRLVCQVRDLCFSGTAYFPAMA